MNLHFTNVLVLVKIYFHGTFHLPLLVFGKSLEIKNLKRNDLKPPISN